MASNIPRAPRPSPWCFWYGQLSALVEPVAAVIGAAAVLTVRPLLPYALAFAAGAMIYVVIEELNPEPHREHSRADLSTLGALRGFNSDDDSRRGAEVKSGEAAHGPLSPPRDSALGSLNKGSPFFSVHELVSVRLSSSLRGGGFTDARRVFVPRQRGARVRERSIVRKGCRIHVRQNWEARCRCISGW